MNICTVKSGKAAATADLIMVLAANADELYMLQTHMIESVHNIGTTGLETHT